MRTAPALLVLTLVASTASVAMPVIGMPGTPSAHAVSPEILAVDLASTGWTERRLPGGLDEVTERLLSPANFTESFSMIGLTWDAPATSVAHEGFHLSVRTRQDEVWTPWQELERDGDAPDRDVDTAAPAGSGAAPDRVGTSPAWFGDSDAFQVRLDRLRGPLPTGLRALLIDPGRSAADAAVGDVPKVVSQAHATIAWPTIHRRKEWGADEKLRDNTPRFTGAVQAGFVHHTAGTNKYSPSDVPKILRGIYAFHVKGRGWADVGYNFLVDRFGRIWEGRAGGVDRTVLGAHTGGFNANSFGVSMLGDFTKKRPTTEALAAVARVIAWKFALVGDGAALDPLGIVELVSAGGGTSRHKPGKIVDFIRISGHQDAGRTACPGKFLYAQLPTIRSLVRQILTEESTYGPALPAGTVPPAPAPAPAPDPVPPVPPGTDEGTGDVTTDSATTDSATTDPVPEPPTAGDSPEAAQQPGQQSAATAPADGE